MMYSDEWMKSGYRKIKPVDLYNGEIILKQWVDNKDELIGVAIDFNYATDIHYELTIEEWNKCFEFIFKCSPAEYNINYIKGFFAPPHNHLSFEKAMKDNNVKFSKFVWY